MSTSIGAKPCSKLLQRVLGEEIAVLPSEVSGLQGPFQSSASDTAALLLALHQLFMSVSQAKLSTDQESAVGCAKTVLTEIVKHLGEKRVLAALAVQGAIADCATVKQILNKIMFKSNTIIDSKSLHWNQIKQICQSRRLTDMQCRDYPQTIPSNHFCSSQEDEESLPHERY